MTKPIDHISSQFPDHPGFPKNVRQLITSGEAEDASWHNDSAPSVERDVRGWVVRLWDFGPSEPGEVNEPRFMVTQWKPDGNDDDRDAFYTNDVRAAVREFRRWVRALLIDVQSPVDDLAAAFDLSGFPCHDCGAPAASEHYDAATERLLKLCAAHKATRT